MLRSPLAGHPRYSCLSLCKLKRVWRPRYQEFCFSWLITISYCACISNPNCSCKVTDQQVPLRGGGPVCWRRLLCCRGVQTLYKGGFLHPAAHWRNASWSRGLLRMRTLVLLLFLAVASRSVASKYRTLAQSSHFLISVRMGGIILIHISFLTRWICWNQEQFQLSVTWQIWWKPLAYSQRHETNNKNAWISPGVVSFCQSQRAASFVIRHGTPGCTRSGRTETLATKTPGKVDPLKSLTF